MNNAEQNQYKILDVMSQSHHFNISLKPRCKMHFMDKFISLSDKKYSFTIEHNFIQKYKQLKFVIFHSSHKI